MKPTFTHNQVTNSFSGDEQPLRVQFPRTQKERVFLETLKRHGFHHAASMIDVWGDRLDLDALNKAWANYPTCMDVYPSQIVNTKVKFDISELG